MPAKTKAILKKAHIEAHGIIDLASTLPANKKTRMVFRSKIKKEVEKRLFLKNDLSEERQLKPQIAEFKSLLKDKSIIPMINFCSWVLDKNPRFKEIYAKAGAMLPIGNIIETSLVVQRLVLFAGIPDHIKGRILKETYPALVKKIKKFKGIK